MPSDYTFSLLTTEFKFWGDFNFTMTGALSVDSIIRPGSFVKVVKFDKKKQPKLYKAYISVE